MNAHNKTQFTYASINCVLKDSSCDTPITKDSHARNTCYLCNQAQQEISKCPNIKNDFIFTHKGLPLFSNRLSIQITQDQKGLSKALMGLSAK
ncbi:hypothetical protein H5410_003550, partial [Solanum commersonii]